MAPREDKHKVRDLTVRLWRDGTGTPLVYLHGAAGVPPWLPFFTQLTGKHEVLVPEHPGFGMSDNPTWIRNVGDVAMYYLDFLDGLGAERVHVVGHSLGGWIAAELAVRNTARLNSLTLVDAAGIHVPQVPKLDTFLLTDEQLVRGLFHDQKRAEATIADMKRPELEDVILKNRTTTARLTWQPRAYDPQLAKWLHRIDVPTLIVWGGNDRLFPPEYAHAWQHLIPGSRVAIIPDCGHVPQIEQRQAFVAALDGFLEGKRAAA